MIMEWYLSIYYTWKKELKKKFQLQRGMIDFNCLMDDILYQIFKNILNIL